MYIYIYICIHKERVYIHTQQQQQYYTTTIRAAKQAQVVPRDARNIIKCVGLAIMSRRGLSPF